MVYLRSVWESIPSWILLGILVLRCPVFLADVILYESGGSRVDSLRAGGMTTHISILVSMLLPHMAW